MGIRRYIIAVTAALLLLGAVALLVYRQLLVLDHYTGRYAMDHSEGVLRRARVSDGQLRLYRNERWEDFEIKGVHLSSFHPGHTHRQDGVEKEDVLEWLEMIAELGANTIKVPYLQPPSFYNALYDFNRDRDEPIYILHGIPIDSQVAIVFYNAYQPEIVRNMRRDIRHTIDALHGSALVVAGQRKSSGLYLTDVSPYVLGYILGDDTIAEFITLTNRRFPHMTMYSGQYYETVDSTAFECFIAEYLDYMCEYEVSTYNTLSLYSYLSSPETDPLEHRNESNATRYADFDLENITGLRWGDSNLLACYTVQPNFPSFVDYEYDNKPTRRPEGESSAYRQYLERLTAYHELPVIVLGTGVPASRGVSLVSLLDGYDRGGHSEQEQGELLLRLLSDIAAAGCQGAVLQGFQDDWTMASPYSKHFHDEDAAHRWRDLQASDNGFGLLEFVPGQDERLCVVDGQISEWTDSPLYESMGVRFSAQADTEYLYLMAEIPGFSLRDDHLYIALDVTPKSGAVHWVDQNLDLPMAADFILHFNGYNESRLLTHSRYDIFRYRYSYYEYILEQWPEMPAPDEPIFNSIYQMNRYNVVIQEWHQQAPVLYHQTGALTHGTADPDSAEYNSLTDFAKEGDVLEVRIPWTLLNVTDPVSRKIQPDFFIDGLGGYLTIRDIGIAMIYRPLVGASGASGKFSYRLPNLNRQKYHPRLRTSAEAVKSYWTE
jgi:hypothetical protein